MNCDEVLTLNVTEFAQSFGELCHPQIPRIKEIEDANSDYPARPGPLRPRRDRPDRRTAQNSDEFPSPHILPWAQDLAS
jgi:hypothetical protein